MSRLPLVDPSQAKGQAAELFAAVKEKMGRVPNLMKAMANSPAVLEGYLGLSGALSHGTLDPQIRERIAIGTAESNGCEYCLAAHSLLGKLAGLDDEERQANRTGHSHDPKADAALAFARTLLERKGEVTAADVQAIRSAGFDDGQVAEIIAHVALNVLTNYFNNAVETPIDFPAVPPLTV
ncbi:MAG: carboxymuconolactone decarboxylase family protein [Isosphaeraceae bacterium]